MITSRRNFLKTAAFGSASLIIGFDGLRLLKGANAETNLFEPSNWIRVDADGAVSLTIGKCEMGQGVRTSLAMILAEELEADWTKIRLVQAKPSPGSDLGTGGSDSIASSWRPLRQAGAAAREMLITAAAARWKVDRASNCRARSPSLRTTRGPPLKVALLLPYNGTIPPKTLSTPMPTGSGLKRRRMKLDLLLATRKRRLARLRLQRRSRRSINIR